MRSVRVLVVDDYEEFRQFVRSTLQKRPDLLVVGEASDGLEAVQKAEALQPDLIVLDIGLPILNGVEAARRIRKVSPESKILILTQESSWDVVQEVLRLGVLGFVVKAEAGSSMLAAVEEVCKGRQSVSAGLDRDFIGITNLQAPDIRREEARSSFARMKSNRRHEVQFYSDDESLIDGFTRYIETALLNGHAVILVATESHRKCLRQKLQGRGVRIAAAIEEGRLFSLGVAEVLSAFMVNSRPDPVRFFRAVGDLITTAAQATALKPSRVAICAECASILWAQGNVDGAIQVEQLCNELTKRYEVDILCGSLSSFYREEDMQVFQKICGD